MKFGNFRFFRENLKLDRYLEPHYHYYTRAMRLKAYQQFLTPYKTVKQILIHIGRHQLINRYY